MKLENISFRGFRNLETQKLNLGAGLQWFVGENGSGKTNTLEAIYFLLTTRSFRSSNMRDLVHEQASQAEVKGWLERRGQKTELTAAVVEGRTRRSVFGKGVTAAEYLRLGGVLAFGAHSRMLVEGGPDQRRRFVDQVASLFDTAHITDLGSYRRGLEQLRQVLRRRGDVRIFRSFKQSLVPVVGRIVKRRVERVADLCNWGRRIYDEGFCVGEGFELRYNREPERYGEAFLERCGEECRRQRVLVGPHLDDVEVVLKGGKARKMGSSGQIRSAVISMKMGAREAFFERFGLRPLLILDDVDGEFDKLRLDRMLEFIIGKGQCVLSTSKCDIIKGCGHSRVFQVKNGHIALERDHL